MTSRPGVDHPGPASPPRPCTCSGATPLPHSGGPTAGARSPGARSPASMSPRSTARSSGSSGESRRTPFDLASHHLSRTDGFFDSPSSEVFEAVEESFRQTDDMEATLRVFRIPNFLNGCADELQAGLVIQLAACTHLESGNSELPNRPRRPKRLWTIGGGWSPRRPTGSSPLAIALRRLRRPPRAACSLLHRAGRHRGQRRSHHPLQLHPDTMDADLVVDSLVSIIGGLTSWGCLIHRAN